MIHDTCPCCEVTRAPHEDDCTFADDCPDACAVFDYVAELRAELAAAKAEVERHRMTREERGAASYFSFFHGSPREDDARSATILLGYLDRTNEVE